MPQLFSHTSVSAIGVVGMGDGQKERKGPEDAEESAFAQDVVALNGVALFKSTLFKRRWQIVRGNSSGLTSEVKGKQTDGWCVKA